MKIKKILKPNTFKVILAMFLIFVHVVSFFKLMDCAFGSGRSILCEIIIKYWDILENFYLFDGFWSVVVGILLLVIIFYVIASILVYLVQKNKFK